MKYENTYYRTSDGTLDIEFFFLDLGENLGWRGYILSDINYKRVSPNRSDVYTVTHLYIDDGQNRYIDADRDYPYICWTQKIESLETMHELAKMWAEITAYYIINGGDFASIEKILRERNIL